MKCPRCGADITEKSKCNKCGLNLVDFRKELEVEYKDFKTLELLDIRQKSHPAPPGSETKIFEEHSGGGAIKDESPAKSSLIDEKNSFPILAVALLILALIIGGFFIVRLLFFP